MVLDEFSIHLGLGKWDSKVILCACLGLGAQTIVPTAKAWVPATPLLQGRGPAAPRRGAISHAPAPQARENIGRRRRWQQRRSSPVGATSAVATGSSRGGGGWGSAAPATPATAFRRLPRSASAFSSRASAWPGRPVAGGGDGDGRGRVAVMMSMAEEEREGSNAVLGALALAGLGAIYYGLHGGVGGVGGLGGLVGGPPPASVETVVETARAGPSAATAAIQGFLSSSVSRIEELGPAGVVYFGVLYVLAEVLAIPAIPLTTAAGFLFGVAGGTAVVLTSATVAAAISFQLGRTLLRQQVEGLLDENPKFRALDKAIAKEGFKVILLLRLSPIFPFALSNYLYGVTSVDFFEYMMGTLIGFFPGTLAYVYGGTVGKAMTDGGGMDLPWYGYAAGAAFVAFLLNTVGTIATNAIEEMEEADP